MFDVRRVLLVIAVCCYSYILCSSDVAQTRLSQFTTKLRNYNDSDLILFHGLLGKKIATAVRNIDPLQPGPLSVLLRDSNTYVNVSLTKVKLVGLHQMRLLDVATSSQHMRASVLLRAPSMTLTAKFKLKGSIDLQNNLGTTIYDDGETEIIMERPAVSWFGWLMGEKAGIMLAAGNGVATHIGNTRIHFNSSRRNETLGTEEISSVIKLALLEEIQRKIEDTISNSLRNFIAVSDVMQPVILNADDFRVLTNTQPFENANSSVLDDVISDIREARMQRNAFSEDWPIFRGGHHRSKRQVPCNNGTRLNGYLDYLLRFGRRIIKVMEPIRGPNLTVNVGNSIQVFLYNLKLRGLHTLSRKKPAYVVCEENGNIKVGVVFQIEQVVGIGKYKVIHDYRNLLFQGDSDFEMKETVLWVQLSQLSNGNNKIDLFRIWKLGKIHIRLRGLGGVTSALSMLLSRAINGDPWNVIPIAEAQMITFGREMLANITVPIFSIV